VTEDENGYAAKISTFRTRGRTGSIPVEAYRTCDGPATACRRKRDAAERNMLVVGTAMIVLTLTIRIKLTDRMHGTARAPTENRIPTYVLDSDRSIAAF
jgi:hypothetical protein